MSRAKIIKLKINSLFEMIKAMYEGGEITENTRLFGHGKINDTLMLYVSDNEYKENKAGKEWEEVEIILSPKRRELFKVFLKEFEKANDSLEKREYEKRTKKDE